MLAGVREDVDECATCKQLIISSITTALPETPRRARQLVGVAKRVRSSATRTVAIAVQLLCKKRRCNPHKLSQLLVTALVTAMALRRIACCIVGLRVAAAYVPPTTRARRSARLSAKKIDFVVEEESRDFLDVSSVFLDSFWADKAGSRELTAAQRRELRSGQLDDFRRRYACEGTRGAKPHYSWPRTALQ